MELLIGQRFGNREITKLSCTDEDWTNIGLNIPARKDKYVLTKCHNCGSILPCEKKNLTSQPPKRCVFCSNIGNHSHIETMTNSWVVKDQYAVCNVVYNNKTICFYIDADRYDEIKKYTWRISKKRQKFYVITGSFKKGTMKYLHDIIYRTDHNGYEIDHIDGNSLNNRRNNLRLVTRQENIDNQIATRIDNQIGIRGIVYNKRRKTYKVDFYYHDQRYYTKEWSSIEEAVWCRYCFEEYFSINSIKNNPLAEKYYTLNEEMKNEIQQYVLNKILGNKR